MLECRNCKYTDCDFRNDILKAINTIGLYVNDRAADKIEEIIEDAIEPCKDFEGMN